MGLLGLLALLISCCDRYRGFSLGLYFSFSLTPVRGGTYFLCCAASKKAKKGASHHFRLSVPLEGHFVSGTTLFILRQFARMFEHRSLRPTAPTRFATSAQTSEFKLFEVQASGFTFQLRASASASASASCSGFRLPGSWFVVRGSWFVVRFGGI
jgi:hypothetical protein